MSADNPFPASDATNAVEITELLGEWFVRVVENGAEQVFSFVMESFSQRPMRRVSACGLGLTM